MADALTPNFNFTQPEVGGSDDTWGNKLNTNWGSLDTLLKAKFDEYTASIKVAADVGDVKMRAFSTVPSGWLECNGAAVSRAAPYDKLFLVIGTIYGVGDGTTTFNLPDYRGEFLRGWDHGRGVDPLRTLGDTAANFQPDGMKSHSHGTDSKTDAEDTTHVHTVSGTTNSAGAHTHTITTTAGVGGGASQVKSDFLSSARTESTNSDGAHTHSVTGTTGGENVSHRHPIPVSTVNVKGADETRPRNQAIMYVIKY
jgi:microcystin-dependent protein